MNVSRIRRLISPFIFIFAMLFSTVINNNDSLVVFGAQQDSVLDGQIEEIIYIHGPLYSQNWTRNNIYVIDNNAGLVAGEILNIEDGTTVLFSGNFSLSIGGTLIAIGLPESPITLSSNKDTPLPGDWSAINFLDTSIDASFDDQGNYLDGSILRYTQIEYGGGVTLNQASPYIADNVFKHESGPVISGFGCMSLRVERNIIEGTYSQRIAGFQLTSMIDSIVSNNQLIYPIQGIVYIGSGEVSENLIRYSSGIGINASGSVTVTKNKVHNSGDVGIVTSDLVTLTMNQVIMGNDDGISTSGGYSQGNLVARNKGKGFTVSGTSAIDGNTIVYNENDAIYISGGTPIIHNNNLISEGYYLLNNGSSNHIDAESNWWGTTRTDLISEAIYDGNDDFGHGIVDYEPYLLEPNPTAPAYVTSITTNPDSPVGLETVEITATFSAPMDTNITPQLSIYTEKRETWQTYNVENSGIAENEVLAFTFDELGNLLVGSTNHGVSVLQRNGEWFYYNMDNSGLADNYIQCITQDDNGNYWFCSGNNGVSELTSSGNWIVYTMENSGLAQNQVWAIADDQEGNMWFGTTGSGVSVLHKNGSWETYNHDNSGLGLWGVSTIAVDYHGNIWFGDNGSATGITVLSADGEWTHYTSENSDLAADQIFDIKIDKFNNVWFAAYEYSNMEYYYVCVFKNDGTWKTYEFGTRINSIAFDEDNRVWLAGTGTGNNYGVYYVSMPDDSWQINEVYTNLGFSKILIDRNYNSWFSTSDVGMKVLYRGQTFFDNYNSLWISSNQWQTYIDTNSLMSQESYIIEINHAQDLVGIDGYPDVAFTFLIDYPYTITDWNPPLTPSITFCSGADIGSLSAQWHSFDFESGIKQYRYAIGTSPGSDDMINWTRTESTLTEYNNLPLNPETLYYFSVKAQDNVNLWSEFGAPTGIKPGTNMCLSNFYRSFLSVIMNR